MVTFHSAKCALSMTSEVNCGLIERTRMFHSGAAFYHTVSKKRLLDPILGQFSSINIAVSVKYFLLGNMGKRILWGQTRLADLALNFRRSRKAQLRLSCGKNLVPHGLQEFGATRRICELTGLYLMRSCFLDLVKRQSSKIAKVFVLGGKLASGNLRVPLYLLGATKPINPRGPPVSGTLTSQSVYG